MGPVTAMTPASLTVTRSAGHFMYMSLLTPHSWSHEVVVTVIPHATAPAPVLPSGAGVRESGGSTYLLTKQINF